ncbi:MAG: TIGR03560 family F420-dependent LLM class oxidoreductase [Pseudomonadales bacterium]|jgi:F420-dependent oxidoreductase-like protein|nr:TIGR03560 family F420-dependent LLM class oxidoreductase [Pseudomonadales bacterium]MDP7360028.1 TIGR03560 family F420-dependent LLM class oxidoreductase [Pseudomonadales bacterium]MDP7598101.1 TIGR03560 family F420-dependent LLM class oxidoreductase [Pseudomonadales bacterium]HJN49402.1 TIGR03560 family F420-dependent LLM class oxidoreductase [Pseudomonadales bacterium]|tara:strand:- start:462 stop:1409 length:948 start_codon:yes stop_codon:yes gene_type:complete
MQIGLMVEGQNGLTWERWIHIIKSAEQLGFPAVYRSDHFYIFGKQEDSLEAYVSFAVAARETKSIRFGPLVTPITFRSPVDLGRMAAQINLLSEGRFILGLGSGWYQPEHDAYGIPFPGLKERFDRLEEGIEVIKALWGEGPASYAGDYYQLNEANCLPKPTEGADTPILIGGAGRKRTLPIAAKYGAEWNCMNLPVAVYRRKLEAVEQSCHALGRDPGSLRRSMASFGLIGHDQGMLDRITEYQMKQVGQSGSPAAYRETMSSRGFITGLTNEVVDQLSEYAELGVAEIQFQHFDYAWDEFPSYLAGELAPRVA